MDRAEAISYWVCLHKTFAEQLEKEENPFGRMHLRTTLNALDMAIAALREQEQREQGCEFCKEDKDGFRTMAGAFSLSEPYHGGRYYLNCGRAKVQRVHYCPMCGRKLKEGAE